MVRKTVPVLCFALAAAAFADEDVPYYYDLEPPPAARYAGAEVISGAGYIPLRAREFPGGARVLDGEVLRNRGYVWLGEALAEEAGVFVEYVPGREGVTMVPRFRGATAREFLLLIDGVPVNDLAGGWADVKMVPIEAVARIEVIPGPASYRWGDGAVAGVINVETMRGPREAARALVSASDGTFDTERYRFNFGMTTRGIDVFVSGNRILAAEPNTFTRDSSANIDGRVARRWGDVGALDLAAGHFTGHEAVLHEGSWEGLAGAPGTQEGGHDRIRLEGRRRLGVGVARFRGYHLVTRNQFQDDETGRGYQTRGQEDAGSVSYTWPHMGGSALTVEGGGGYRALADAAAATAVFSTRVLEEVRPAAPLYLAVGAAYDAFAGGAAAVSPRLAVAAFPREWFKAYGSFSGGVRLPALAALGRREEVIRERGYEAGVRFYRRGAAEAGAAVFYSHGGEVYLPEEERWAAELDRRGVEVSGGGKLPLWFDWRGSYCFTDARDARGEEVGFVPRHRAFGQLGYLQRFLSDDLTLRAEGRLEYVGARRRTYPAGVPYIANPSVPVKIPYAEELPAFWQAGVHFSLAVVSFEIYCNVENINRARDYVFRPGYATPRKVRTYVGFNWTLYD